jgi:hypothetical protein
LEVITPTEGVNTMTYQDDFILTSELTDLIIEPGFEYLPEPPNWKSPARLLELENRLIAFASFKGFGPKGHSAALRFILRDWEELKARFNNLPLVLEGRGRGSSYLWLK